MAAVAGMPEEGLQEALDELAAAQLGVPSRRPAGGTVRFKHALVP